MEQMMEWILAKMDSFQEMETCKEMLAKMEDKSDATIKEMEKEIKAGEGEIIAEHQEVPKEEAAVEMIGGLKERYGDRHLAVGRRRQLKSRTQDSDGSRKKLVAARRRTTRPAGAVPRKGHGCQVPGRDSVARGTSTGRTFGKRRRAQPESSSGIRDRDLKE
jgi:hypothetical protein